MLEAASAARFPAASVELRAESRARKRGSSVSDKPPSLMCCKSIFVAWAAITERRWLSLWILGEIYQKWVCDVKSASVKSVSKEWLVGKTWWFCGSQTLQYTTRYVV